MLVGVVPAAKVKGGAAELVEAVWVLLALAFRALWRRSAVCRAGLWWCSLRQSKKYSVPRMLGAARRRLWKELVMVKKSRESCSCACRATTARLDERCGVGGRSEWHVDSRWLAVGTASRLLDVVVGCHCTADHWHLGAVAAGVHVGGGRCATLRCAATRPDARCHALDRSLNAGHASACSEERSAALRSALAPFVHGSVCV